MLQWLQIIGEFLLNHIEMLFEFLFMARRASGTFVSAIAVSPSFLKPILLLILALIMIMWVVNLF